MLANHPQLCYTLVLESANAQKQNGQDKEKGDHYYEHGILQKASDSKGVKGRISCQR